ncbi:hypothetical protein C2E23DRAFT_858142 [Lenzites betulinus]|nr:hypothetical protein C2E23DRAFT_858142 [Lenzites betulinus]
MASIHRPLHPLHINTSNYSSLTGAVSRTQCRRSVPTGTLTPSPGRYLKRLDQTIVRFDTVVSAHGTEKGISFDDVKAKNFSRLLHPETPVFQGLGKDTLAFRIMWPGYAHFDWHCTLPTSVGGRPITRAHLAVFIVETYGRFFERIRQAHYVGPCGENGSWVIPRDARQYQLILKSVSNLHGHDAIFQAEIDIVTFM